jgi:hypothetical protein
MSKLGSRVAKGLVVAGLCALLAVPRSAPAPASAAAEGAACTAIGRYTVLAQGWRYALSAPPPALFPLVTGGSATISRYTGCGTPTLLTLITTGSGTLLQHPVKPLIGNRLRAAGDILLRFTGTARQDPHAPADPRAVRLNGTAVYVHVTSKGVQRGTRTLAYASRTVKISNVPATLKVTTDLTGAFSLSCALPGPLVGKVPSEFSYFVVGVRNPAGVHATTPPSRNL